MKKAVDEGEVKVEQESGRSPDIKLPQVAFTSALLRKEI